MIRGIVYVMAKAPAPGAVKTRLCPPLTGEQASALATAFAIDLMERLAGARDFDVRLALDEQHPGAGDCLRDAAHKVGVSVEDQGGGDLGTRMARLLARGISPCAARSAMAAPVGAPTLLVGSDVPDLPLSLVDEAMDALDRRDVVLVPSRDGGYVLVGARRRVDELFLIDAQWSGARVFAATCDSLTKAGCPFATLPAWEDIDDAAALGRLAIRLTAPGAERAPRTVHLIEQWRRDGVRI